MFASYVDKRDRELSNSDIFIAQRAIASSITLKKMRQTQHFKAITSLTYFFLTRISKRPGSC